MKAFLLAAGHGTRLRPLTDTVPKCMVPIRGVAMLDIWLQICDRVGIDEVLINLHAHSEPVRAALQHSKRRVRVILSEEPVLLGSAGTLACNRGWVEAEPYFWVLYADVLTNANLNEMLQFHIIKSALPLRHYRFMPCKRSESMWGPYLRSQFSCAGIRGKACPPAK